MRHGIAGNKLGRNQSLRKATVRDLAKATLKEQRICTTKAKAKEARKLVDKLITMGKKGTLAEKRRAFAVLCDHKLVSQLFNDMAPKFKERNGGYTRIISLGNRRGDNAELAFLELTEKTEVVVSKPKAEPKKEAVKAVSSSEETETKSSKGSIAPKSESKSVKNEAVKPDKSKKMMGGLKQMFNRKSASD